MIDHGFLDKAGRRVAIRLSYHPENTAARQLYESLGFVPAGAFEDDEIVAELVPRR